MLFGIGGHQAKQKQKRKKNKRKTDTKERKKILFFIFIFYKVTDQTCRSKPRKAPLKPRPAIGQSRSLGAV